MNDFMDIDKKVAKSHLTMRKCIEMKGFTVNPKSDVKVTIKGKLEFVDGNFIIVEG